MPKLYVQALEAQVASLEIFIHRPAAVGRDEERKKMLHDFIAEHSPSGGARAQPLQTSPGDLAGCEGQLYKTRGGSSARFYGGTSLFNIHLAGLL